MHKEYHIPNSLWVNLLTLKTSNDTYIIRFSEYKSLRGTEKGGAGVSGGGKIEVRAATGTPYGDALWRRPTVVALSCPLQ